MICPKCRTANETSNAFCVNCGETLTALPQSSVPTLISYSGDAPVPPTQVFQAPPGESEEFLSSPTVIAGSRSNHHQAPTNYDAPHYNAPNFNAPPAFVTPLPTTAPAKSRTGLLIGAGLFLLFLLGGSVIGALILISKSAAPPTDNVNLQRETNAATPTPDSTNANSKIEKRKPTPNPTVAPPDGAKTASTKTNVVLRSEPSLTGQKIATLRRGQKIYVVGYSENTDYWNGQEGKWANVQTESGQRGWVFSPLIN